MWNYSQSWILFLSIMLLSSSSYIAAERFEEEENYSVKKSIFFSPPIYLNHGSVQDKYYHDIPFPRGHIAIKSFDGELVDENGNSIPLHETYLHHWLVARYYYSQKEAKDGAFEKFIYARNSGPCTNLGQYFGLGSETRKTNTWVPDPYGIVIGNPLEIPEGYEEKWLLNVHAIDTRNVEDRLGCTECKCSLYNVTSDEYGRSLANGYVGGLHCCYDETRCRVEEGLFDGGVRKLYLKYTVKWIEWNPRILPVQIFILDVTDSTGDYPINAPFSCKVEYSVPSCDHSSSHEANRECVDIRKAKVVLPHGGDIIYGVAHQHTGGVGSALYGEDGQLLCSSYPFYGKGKEAGDEAGYIVGMSTCYPKPGSLNIRDGELLTLISNYSSLRMHTGVMGLFYLLLAEPAPRPKLNTLFSLQEVTVPYLVEHWWVVLLAGGIMSVVAAAICRRRNERDSYQMVFN